MKKALVILLTLAVAGGLFAQTFTWNGAFEGGIGMRTMGDDDMIFGAVAPTNWVSGTRAQLQLSYTNADGNAGARLRFRASGASSGFNGEPFFHQAWAWVKPFGDIVEFRGGRIHDDQLATQDPILGTYLLNSHGIVAYIRPMDMITVGLGATSGQVAFDATGPTGSVGISSGKTWENSGLAIWGGLGVNVPSLLSARVQFNTSYEVVNLIAGVQVTALEAVPINLVFRAWDLTDGDIIRMAIHGFIGVNMIDNLGITVGGAFSNRADRDDPYMAFGGWFTYALGNIVPRIDLWYVSGGAYAYGYGFNATGSNIDYGAMTYNKDQTYFSIRPAVQLRATATTWWELGAAINMDLGDVSAVGLAKKGTSIGFFTAARVNF